MLWGRSSHWCAVTNDIVPSSNGQWRIVNFLIMIVLILSVQTFHLPIRVLLHFRIWCTSRALSRCEDVVAVASVGKVNGLSKALGTWGWTDERGGVALSSSIGAPARSRHTSTAKPICCSLYDFQSHKAVRVWCLACWSVHLDCLFVKRYRIC